MPRRHTRVLPCLASNRPTSTRTRLCRFPVFAGAQATGGRFRVVARSEPGGWLGDGVWVGVEESPFVFLAIPSKSLRSH